MVTLIKNEMSIRIFGTCLQTSSIKYKPNEINGNLNFKNSWDLFGHLDLDKVMTFTIDFHTY